MIGLTVHDKKMLMGAVVVAFRMTVKIYLMALLFQFLCSGSFPRGPIYSPFPARKIIYINSHSIISQDKRYYTMHTKHEAYRHSTRHRNTSRGIQTHQSTWIRNKAKHGIHHNTMFTHTKQDKKSNHKAYKHNPTHTNNKRHIKQHKVYKHNIRHTNTKQGVLRQPV